MKTEKDLGMCQRCKKNKATIEFTESTLNLTHGFVEHICQECLDKMQRATPLYKKAIQERNAQVREVIGELFINGKLRNCFKDITEEELLKELGLKEEK